MPANRQNAPAGRDASARRRPVSQNPNSSSRGTARRSSQSGGGYPNARNGSRRGASAGGRPGSYGRPVNRGVYNSGITSYDRKGITSANNPYKRANMIYGKPPRRNWPIVIGVVVVLLVIIILCVTNCHACNRENEEAQQAQQTQQSQQQQQQAQDQKQTTTVTSDKSIDELLNGQDKVTVNTQAGASVTIRSADNRMKKSSSKNKTKPSKKTVYLTFDDGPSTNTHKIMDILDRYGVKATWFVIGTRGHLDYTKELWAAGHQIALHSYTHEYDQLYASNSACTKEFNKIGKAVKKQIGFFPTILRYPGGSVNGYNSSMRSEMLATCRENGWHYFDWNISSGDASSNNVPAKKIVKNIKKESKGCNSCCVLMHDTEAKDTTVEALPEIIEYYISEGFTFDVLVSNSFGYHF